MQQHHLAPAGLVEPLLRDAPWSELTRLAARPACGGRRLGVDADEAAPSRIAFSNAYIYLYMYYTESP